MPRSVYRSLATSSLLVNCCSSIRPCLTKIHRNRTATFLYQQPHIQISKRNFIGTPLPIKEPIMGRETIKMLVLETDVPHPETQQRRGNFGHVFKQLFEQAGDAHDPPLGVETDMHYVVETGKDPGHVPTIEEISEDVRAIIISGSMYDAHGNDEWILKLVHLLQDLWKTRPKMRFSGVCTHTPATDETRTRTIPHARRHHPSPPNAPGPSDDRAIPPND
jgi:hypothetical protein